MTRLVWRQLRSQFYRSAAVAGAVLVASVGFAILTAATDEARVVVQRFVDANSRGAYDVLVRPSGVRDPTEIRHGLVRPGHLVGQANHLSIDQWRAIANTPGVEVAAPAGVLAYVAVALRLPVDITDAIAADLPTQVIRVWPTFVADAGLSRIRDREPRFAYVTTRPVAVPTYVNDGRREGFEGPDGVLIPQADLLALGCADVQVPFAFLERSPAGRWVPICGTQFLDAGPDGTSGTAEMNSATFSVFARMPDGSLLDYTNVTGERDDRTGSLAQPRRVTRAQITVEAPLWIPVAVIDPAEENRLVGLDQAVTRGRPLPRSVTAKDGSVPALIATDVAVDEQLATEIARIGPVDLAGIAPRRLLDQLSAAPATVVPGPDVDVRETYRASVATNETVRLDLNVNVSRVTVAETRPGQLTAATVDFDRRDAWQTPVSRYGETGAGRWALEPPWAQDLAFRSVTKGPFPPPTDVLSPPVARVVGQFDPARLNAFSEFAALPLELYGSGVAARTPDGRAVQLQPSTSPTGYLPLQPALLVSVDAARQLVGADAVISQVRVRVAGVTGVDPASRERVRQVAERLIRIGGLEVDVTLGSSPQVQAVHLPSGRYGRPSLTLAEPWPRKGAAVDIVRAANRKDVVLFGLLLVACLCFLGNASSAAVRGRRGQLAILVALGWSRGRVLRLLLTEAAILGAGAGLVAVPAGALLARMLDLEPSPPRTLATVPAATLVAAVAALYPGLRATRPYPAEVTFSPVVGGRRRGSAATRRRMALTNIARTPGRTIGGAVAVAVAVAAASTLVSVMAAFEGSVAGTTLGDATYARVRGVDLVVLGVLWLLGVASVADIVWIGLRERVAQLSLLRAVGWSRADVVRLSSLEAAFVGLAGAVIGAAAALVGVHTIAGTVSPLAAATTAALAVIGGSLALAAGLAVAAASPEPSMGALSDDR